MVYIVNVTSQGQINLPSGIRKKVGIKKQDKVLISENGGKIVVEPIIDLLDLKGCLKSNKKSLSNDQIHEVYANARLDEMGLIK